MEMEAFELLHNTSLLLLLPLIKLRVIDRISKLTRKHISSTFVKTCL